jgi:Lon protease-like protein
VRTAVGTVATILQAEELDDGRWVLGAVGTRRIRVTSWLPDDPYPRADVEDWPDEPVIEAEADDELDTGYRDTVTVLRRVLALKAELAEPAADATVELAPDPGVGSYQAAAVAPLGPADQYALLAAPGVGPRLADLRRLLEEEEGFLRARLAW